MKSIKEGDIVTGSTETLTSGVSLAVDKLQSWTADFYILLPNILAGVLMLAIFFLVAYGFKRLLKRYFKNQGRIDLGRLIADIVFWLVVVFGLLVALTIIMPSIKPVDLISGLGIGSLAIGFAFKDILQNWLAGLLILLRLPFRRGDQIAVNSIEGTVQRIEPRATIIRTYDGKDIVVPNTTIYTNEVTIQTSQTTRRVEINITVGYDYDIEYIKQIILEALKPIKEVIDKPAPQVLAWDLGSTSLGLKIRWWISSERSEEVISRARAIQALKETFQANDIDPTDPDLVYTMKAASSEDPDGDGKPAEKGIVGKRQKIKAAPPPPDFEMGEDDPETYTAKADAKEATMLANE